MATKAKHPEVSQELNQIESFLFDIVQELEPDWQERRRNGPGRARILPALCLWAGLVVCILRGVQSQLGLWRLLSEIGLWSYPRFAVTDQAVYNRLARDGTAAIEKLYEQISAVLHERLAPYVKRDLAPFAEEVIALDETTLDKMSRHLPQLRALPAGASKLLAGKLAATFDLRRQQWREIRYIDDPNQNEKVAARSLLETLPPNSLILADLGYFGFAWFDDLTRNGYWFISRLRAKTSYKTLHINYQQGSTLDAIVWLGAHRADRAAHAVRLVQFQVGETQHRYITNVLDPQSLSLADIARLYPRRWDIEMAFRLIKQHLNLHMIWSGKPEVIQLQIWAILIIAQIFQALRFEIAAKAGVDVFDVSIPLLVEYFPQLTAQGIDPVAFFVERGRSARFIRPSRRTRIRAPDIPAADLIPMPVDLVCVRTPRYSQRKC
jgi:hypothetical protein